MRELIELIGSTGKSFCQYPRSEILVRGVNKTLEKVSAEYDNTTIADWLAPAKAKGNFKTGLATKRRRSVLQSSLPTPLRDSTLYRIYPPLKIPGEDTTRTYGVG